MSERAVHCLACGEALLPRLDECFLCAQEAGIAAPRRAMRYRVTAVSDDAEGLATGLEGLLERPADATAGGSARWFVFHPPFDVVLEGTDLQHEMLVGLLAGAKHDAVSIDAPALPESFRWVGRPLAWKLGTTVVVGAAAVALGTASVLGASVGMAALLAGRGAHLVQRSLEPTREAVDGLLDVLEPDARAAYRAARSTIVQPGTKGALDQFIGTVVAARGEGRARGGHLRDAEVRKLDVQLGRVTRDLCGAVARAARGAPVAVETAGYRQAATKEGPADPRALLVSAARRALDDALAAPGGAGAKAAILARYVPGRSDLVASVEPSRRGAKGSQGQSPS